MRAVRVVVVDDQPIIRAALRALLETTDGMEVVGDAGDGAAALELVARLRPDVALMDIRMPQMDGIEATRRIRATHPDTRVVVLTTFDFDEHVFAAIRAGASGYLLKDGDADDLVRAVRLAAEGESVIAPGALRRLLEEFAAQPARSAGSDALNVLTDREQQVLRLVAQGLTNAEIAARLHVSPGTTKTHVSNLLAKLGVRDRVAAVVLAYESGLVTPG